MEIKLLQSLIDRTSNRIAELEGVLSYRIYVGFEPDERDRYSMKKEISKLAKIQKALKQEIAKKLEWQSFRLHYAKKAVGYRKGLQEKWAAEELEWNNHADNP